MKKTFAAFALCLTPLFAHADEALVARPEVKEYLAETAQDYGFDEADLVNLFTRVEPKPNILAIFDRPSTGRPWYAFHTDFVNASRINSGAAFWREHEKDLAEISQAYQVDPAVIVAILDVETLFGKNTGSFRVLDVLATAAFDYPRRADFFRKELTEFLLLARGEKEDPLSFKGSYAGAMGWPQFMPSSFRAFAVDWNNDGHHDIWNTPVDAMASVASYLALHGWQMGGDSMVPVNVSGDQIDDLIADKFNLHYSVAELIAKGVIPPPELETTQPAVLYPLEVSPGEIKYFLGFKNFYAITRYNKSTLYATAVLELADAIREAKSHPPVVETAKPAKSATATKHRKPAKPAKRAKTTTKKKHA
ncbi:MAG: lytic murein transglycosylase B [Formivibrio sp.]|nr:lytic murein transglycosylase B [Formivibrio sp.]